MEFSIFEKVRAARRMMDAAMPSDNSAPAAAPAKKVPVEKRVPYRDPETGKVLWKTIMVEE